MGVFLFVLCFYLLLPACSPRDVLFWAAVAVFVVIGIIYPEFLGKLIGYGFATFMAYAFIYWVFQGMRALWRHLRGLPAPVPPPPLRLQPKAPPRRLPRDLLLPGER